MNEDTISFHAHESLMKAQMDSWQNRIQTRQQHVLRMKGAARQEGGDKSSSSPNPSTQKLQGDIQRLRQKDRDLLAQQARLEQQAEKLR